MALRRIAVVGASLAGLRTLEALRRRGFEGELTLVGEELERPYDRPPLSKQLLRGEWGAEKIMLRKQGLEDLAVDLRLGVRALALDAERRRIQLSDGAELAYDGLVIATGASPRRLPFGHDLAGVHVLRTLEDARAIARELGARPRVCVIGAGFIGLEVAASCRKLGLEVTAVDPMPVPLSDKVGATIAERILQLHRGRDVDLRLGVRVQAIEGSGRAERVVLSDGGVIETGLVVVGIGVTPNVAWLEGSGLDLGDGVSCDESCATALPDVVAAGDVARWPNSLFGRSARVEHWTNAVEMAGAAAARLLEGAGAPAFAPVPYFWSDQYEVKIQFAGVASPDDELTTVEDAPAEQKLVVLYSRDGVLTGVLAIGRPAQLIKYRRMIGERAPLARALEPG